MVSIRTASEDTAKHCPQCGCAHYHEGEQFEWFGKLCIKVQCRHCLRTWAVSMEPEKPMVAPPQDGLQQRSDNAVMYDSGSVVHCKCPLCGKENPRQTGTKSSAERVTRHHKCQQCEHSFKSFEFIQKA